MSERGLHSTFEQDTKNFINQINGGLIKLENDGYCSDTINHIFRCIHSIKSEAAYLNYSEISEAAHDMESIIEPLRNVNEEVEIDPAIIEFCFSTVDKIEALSNQAVSADDAEEVLPLSPVVEQQEASEQAAEAEMDRPYTEFELMLLRDARARGESLYTLSFGIAEDEAMKYPRAYLAVSNLEQRVNVIKVEPEPEKIDASGENIITVLLSSSGAEQKILDEIDVDQIINIELTEKSYEQELQNLPAEPVPGDGDPDVMPAEPEKSSPNNHERVISVEAEEIDAISNYVSEIKQRLSDLSSAVAGGQTDSVLDSNLAGLESISENIENMMSNLKTVDFNFHFAGYKRTVRDIAAETGKRAELVFPGDSVRIDRDFAGFIAEPLLQLIRNSVVHGIEPPEQREAAGKNPSGRIELSAVETAEGLKISLLDDGAGVDIAELPEEYSGIETDDQLLELLTQPGYTSLEESGPFGGRGVGLDLVTNRIRIRGGRMELENRPGKSCKFTIIIPDNNAKV